MKNHINPKTTLLILAVMLLVYGIQSIGYAVCDRTPEVRDAIVAAVPDVTDCANVTEAHLADITSLNLASKSIAALKAGDFDGLTALTELRLNNNQISTLPAAVFDELTALTTLRLDNNQLTTLPDGVFDQLTALTTLYLFSNQLTTLSDGVFDKLTALTTLYLYRNQLTTLSDGVFDKLTALTKLYLFRNQLTTLSDGVFDKLTALTYIWLSENQLTTLPDGVFDKLTALTTLQLDENQLTTLPDGVFDKLTALTTLRLDSNQLTTLSASVFDKLTALRTLQLDNNQLTTLPDGVFDQLTALRTLQLDENQLTTLSAGVFDQLTALTTLNLYRNQISTLPEEVFDKTTALERLYLHNNQISTLTEEVFEGLTELTTLWLTGNPVDPLPLTVSLKQVAEGEFKATVHTGAPFKMELPLTVTNGTTDGGATTITIPIGNVESGSLTVSRTTGTTAAVTVTIGTLPDPPSDHFGYELTKSSDLPLTVISELSNNAPTFDDGDDTTRSIAENTAAGQNIGSAVEATDDDSGDTLTYTLGGTDAASFDIVGTSGQLQTKDALDYETDNSYSVTVSVSDGNSGSDSIDVTINVTNVNEAPAFPATTDTRSIAENTAAATNIGTAVSATDPDVTSTNTDVNLDDATVDALTYTLSGTTDEPNDYQTFDIDTATGQLKTKDALDYETKTSYKMTVSVSDGALSNTITVTINITNVNEAPTFPATTDTRSIAENTAAATNIGTAVSATDPDVTSTNTDVNPDYATVDALTYTLGGTTDEPNDYQTFDIDTATGQLKTKDALDYETKNSYEVTVTVSDGALSASITVTISVTNVNEAPTFPATTDTRSIAENTGAGTDIGAAVTATDPDVAGTNTDVNPDDATVDALTYTLGGTDAASFAIVSTSGQLQTKAALDYETKDSYEVTVTVSDGGTDTASVTVTISVTDVNETGTNNAPEFTDGDSTTRSVAENTAAGEDIGSAVEATDDDSGDPLTYTLGGTDAASFDIVGTSGQLQTKSALDYEATKNAYSVTVSVSDGNSGSDSIDVTINITNVNEAPTFPATTDTTLEVTKHTPEGTDIGDPVAATDPDVAGTNTDVNLDDANVDALTYTLGGTDATSFDIDSDTGQLKTKTGVTFDRTTQSSYMVTVTASDGEFTASTPVVITVVVTPVCDRTEQVRDAIVAAVPGVTECADVTETHLAAITGPLNLANKSITALKAGDFDGLTALTELDLNNNQIRTLPSGVFGELTALTTLYLNINRITTLPPGVFDQLTALTTLDLNNNQITTGTLPPGVFDQLTALTTLSLNDNQLTTLPAVVFDQLTALTTLRLSGNRLRLLDEDVFDGLTALTGLFLTGNQLINLKEDVFDGLTALTTLFLDENQLISLEEDVFDGLTALATLRLTNNKISPLPAGVFEGLTALTTLYLDGADLTALPADVFEGLTALTTLTLDDNDLTALPADVFDGLTALTTLTLSRNDITALPADVFEGLTTLSVLRLNNNKLSTLPAGVFDGLTALTRLFLNNNTVNPLPLTVSLKQVAEGEFKATAHTGAPFEMVLPVTVTNGSIDGTATTITVPIGNVESESLTVTRTTGTTATVTVNIGTLPGLPSDHTGYALSKSSDLPLKVISDTSNNAPEFTDGTETTRSVAENAEAGTNIGSAVAATDDDTTDTLTYRLNGTDADSFDIVSTTGQLKTKAALDRATKSSYSVTVVVTDGNGGIDSIAVTITVTEPNNVPEFTDGTETTRSVAENTPSDTAFGAPVAATDDDPTDTLTYTLGGTDAASFAIVSSSGQLKTKAALDYEATKNAYSVTVSVSDSTHTDSIDVTINVTNVNEAPAFPDTTDTTLEVTKHTPIGTDIGDPVAATDLDGDTDVNPTDATVDALTYTLGGTDATSFDIDSDTGQLKTKTGVAFDRTTKSSYMVTVTASDGEFMDSTSVGITVVITPVCDRTLAVRDAIVAKVPGVTNCADVTETHLAAITGPLSLSNKSITALKAGDFDGLTALTELSLNNNQITTLPAGVFDEITALTELSLNNNQITTLPAGVFDQLTALTELRLDSNQITTLPAGVFDELTALIDLLLSYNQITTLPAGVFDQLTALTELYLHVNQISTLSAEVFDKLTALTTLSLFRNQISTLPAGVFDELTALTTLSLYSNQISTLPAGVFDKLTALTTLYLDNNQISTLPAGVFDKLTALTRLDLYTNQISTLPAGVFDKLTALTTLSLYSNQISTLPAGVFDELTALTLLSLSRNQISTLPAGVFDKLTALTTLYLHTNQISTLPEEVFDKLTALTALYLHNNQISTLTEEVFDGLTALTTLYLNGNTVDPLPLTVSLKQVAEGEFKATAHTGAPFGIVLPVTVTHGTIDGGATTITVPIGNVESESLTVTRTTGTTDAVTVTIGTLPGLPSGHQGYALTKSSDLPLTVISEPSNNAPEFTDGTETTRSVAENTAAGENIGDPVAATDDDTTDTLTYRLNGTDADSFDIVSTSGQLKTKAALDRETKSSYSVTVVVTDGNGGIDSIAVTISVTEPNYAPEFTDGDSTTRSVAENTEANINIGAAVTATDPDLAGTNTDANPETSTPDTLTYTLSGTTDQPNDYQTFDIDTATGQLKTKDALDYETQPSYEMTVTASDGTLSDTITVTISVTNVNEAPTFPDTTNTTLEVTKHTPIGTDIGDPVAATDLDGDTDVNPTDATVDALTYTLGGTDAASFDIDSDTGQLKTKTGVAFDRTTKSSYMVTVTTSDGEFMASTSVGITVVVTPVCDRTPAVRDAIVAKVPGVSDCADVTETHLAAITSLSLSNKSITALKAGDFDGLTALTELSLDNNQITTLPAGVFDEITALTELYLNNNQISTLPAGVFNEITALTTLRLDSNQITTLPEGVFDELTALIDLLLSHNQISTLPAGVFDKLTALTELYLHNNQISTLTAGVFDKLTALTTLYLHYNQISILTAGVFDELTALETLRLYSNQISMLTAGVFDELTALTRLDLDSNQISTLQAGVFDGLTALTRLDLYSNQISTLPAGVFDELTALTRLYLYSNQISTLPAGVFDKLTALELLSLSRNQISTLTAGVFDKLTALTELYLHTNQISTLPAGVFDKITALTALYLHNNQISTLPAGVFEGLTALTTLNLNNNTVNPLPLTVSLKQVAEGEFKATAHTGAPFGMVLPVTVTNGTLDGGATTITIPIGSVESESLTVTRTIGTTVAVTVTIGTLPGLPSGHQGYALSKSSDLPLTVISEPSNNAPEFTDGTETTREVAENTASDTAFGDPVAATDDDPADTLTYRLNGTDADSFDIVSTTGQLKTKAALDRETKSSYSVTVVVTDSNGGIDSIAVTITVTEANYAPEFNDDDSTTREVDENTPSDTAFDDPVEATDDDSGDPLTYTLSGTDAASFDIVSSSGQLKTKAALDYETDNSYSVTVSVSDGNGGSDSIDVTINVTNVNEAPTFPVTTATRSVAENTEAGINIGAAVAATDPDVAGTNTNVNPDDATVDALTYTLGGTDAASFDIVSTSGQLQTKAALDYETKDSYEVTVTVSDGGTDTASVTVTISVTDVDETQPTVSITVPSGAQNGAFDVTVVFSEAVTGFVQSELVVTGTSGASITAWNPQTGGTDYKATITPTSSGTAIFNVAANVAKDTADNQNTAATQKTVQVDMTSPTVSITVPSGAQNGAFDVTVVFSEAVTGFVQSELVVTGTSGASITAWNPQTGGTDYKATITPTSSGTAIFNVAANVAKDTADNQNTAATQQTVQVNLTRPTVIINTPSGVQNGAFDVTVVFSEAVTGFVQSELVVTGTSGASITAWNPQTGGTDYEATITPTSSGTAIFNVAANVAKDTADNQNTTATQKTVQVDMMSPTVSITVPSGVQNGAFDVTVVFSEAVTGFVQSELVVTGTSGASITAWNPQTGGTDYEATITPTSSGTAIFNVAANVAKDTADNQNTAATQKTVQVDMTSPTVSINVPSGVQNGAFDVTVVFSEAVTGFVQSELVVTGTSGASITAWNPQTGGTDYRATITPTSSGTAIFNVAANVAVDSGSNQNTAAIQQTVAIDLTQVPDTDTRPDPIMVAMQNGVEKRDQTVTFATFPGTFQLVMDFDRPVTGFERSELAVHRLETGVTVTGWRVSSDRTVYTATVQVSHTGGVTFTVPANAAQAVDDGQGNRERRLTVIVEGDPNQPNRAPVFSEGTRASRTVAENTPSSRNIGSPVTATDADGDTLTYLLSGTDASSFGIDVVTGQLQTQADLDYETKSSYTVTITVSDDISSTDALTDTITVTINVTDVDDTQPNRAPAFASDSTTRSVAENTSANQNIGSPVSATDQDGDTLTYSLKAHSDSPTDYQSFDIIRTTGQLQTKTGVTLDFETKSSYKVTVEVSDGRGGTDTITVTINITDANDTPVFTDGDSTTRSVAGNTAAGENIGTAVAATDDDSGDTLTYTLSGDDAASFDIDTATGQLKVKVALDFETKTSYSVTVSVSDSNGASDTIAVTISVTNLLEGVDAVVVAYQDGVAKEIITGPFELLISFNEPVTGFERSDLQVSHLGENLSTVITGWSGPHKRGSAGDTDYKATITPINNHNMTFRIHAGAAHAVDDGRPCRDIKYLVLIDLDDGDSTEPQPNQPPVFAAENTTRSIAENTGANVNIGDPVSATDSNSGDTLTYSLKAHSDSPTDYQSFDIISTTGQLQTKTGVTLDFETKSSYKVTVEVSDGRGGTDTITVTITVTDVDETLPNRPPVFATDSTTRSIAENTGANVNIGEPVAATDQDGDTLTYSLKAHSDSPTDYQSFDIISTTGQLQTKTGVTLDFETKSSYKVTVEVSDGRGGTDTITVTINVTDVDEAPPNRPPVFAPDSTTRSIAETTKQGLKIGEPVSATDPDGDTLTYSLEGTDAASFSIDSATGQLKTKAPLNRATKSQYSVTVKVSDGESGTDTITVTIKVLTPDRPEPLMYAKQNGVEERDQTVKRGTFQLVMDFDQPVTGFERSDLGVDDFETGATITRWQKSADGKEYTATVRTQNTGSVTFTVPANVAQAADDGQGNVENKLLVLVTDSGEVNVAPASGTEILPPDETLLLPNYPNPFNPETWIPYQLAKDSNVQILIYNVRGTIVRRLALRHQSAGFYTNRSRAAHWDGRNTSGERVAAGIYFYQLRADTVTPLRKMVILK